MRHRATPLQNKPLGNSSAASTCSETLSLDVAPAEKFDLMNIQITVYSLSGITCRYEKSKKKSSTSRTLRGIAEGATGRSKSWKKKSSSPASKALDTTPTTAVVSCRRNIVSSGTEIETFLPSRVLKKPLLGFDQTRREIATWDFSTSSFDLDAEDAARLATINITRVLQRKSFRPDENICQIANYIPETIDLQVGVSRGKEVIPLAVACVAVTGEEEEETIINAPVRAGIFVTSSKRSKRKLFKPISSTSTEKRKQACFATDPDYVYYLEENAILRVGVKVNLSQGMIQESDTFSKKDTLDDILAGLYEESVILELNDENSLLQRLWASQAARQNVEPDQSDSVQDPPNTQPILTELFCGAFEMCAAENPEPPEVFEQSEQTKPTPKKTAAVVLPLSLMSSVSESTFGAQPHSPILSKRRAFP